VKPDTAPATLVRGYFRPLQRFERPDRAANTGRSDEFLHSSGFLFVCFVCRVSGWPSVSSIPSSSKVGLSKEKVEELFWDTVTQIRADLAGIPRK
jgi:hypothetical protein